MSEQRFAERRAGVGDLRFGNRPDGTVAAWRGDFGDDPIAEAHVEPTEAGEGGHHLAVRIYPVRATGLSGPSWPHPVRSRIDHMLALY